MKIYKQLKVPSTAPKNIELASDLTRININFEKKMCVMYEIGSEIEIVVDSDGETVVEDSPRTSWRNTYMGKISRGFYENDKQDLEKLNGERANKVDSDGEKFSDDKDSGTKTEADDQDVATGREMEKGVETAKGVDTAKIVDLKEEIKEVIVEEKKEETKKVIVDEQSNYDTKISSEEQSTESTITKKSEEQSTGTRTITLDQSSEETTEKTEEEVNDNNNNDNTTIIT
uniref:Uncharacterized protein n=1 Tax=Meloidogyne enterolobii TaxID=390850 RepID=A0A6V7U523_MELEN|nr:unnamed protein product [Meloidogyne enterolobii]